MVHDWKTWRSKTSHAERQKMAADLTGRLELDMTPLEEYDALLITIADGKINSIGINQNGTVKELPYNHVNPVKSVDRFVEQLDSQGFRVGTRSAAESFCTTVRENTIQSGNLLGYNLHAAVSYAPKRSLVALIEPDYEHSKSDILSTLKPKKTFSNPVPFDWSASVMHMELSRDNVRYYGTDHDIRSSLQCNPFGKDYGKNLIRGLEPTTNSQAFLSQFILNVEKQWNHDIPTQAERRMLFDETRQLYVAQYKDKTFISVGRLRTES